MPGNVKPETMFILWLHVMTRLFFSHLLASREPVTL